MAVIKDVYSEEESVHMISKVTFVIALSPAAAPIFGGYIGNVACFKSATILHQKGSPRLSHLILMCALIMLHYHSFLYFFRSFCLYFHCSFFLY